MKSSIPLFPSAIFLLLLLFGTGIARNSMVVEVARTCHSLSSKFKGLCFSNTNCGTVCKTEGFQGGHCTGFIRKCSCTKPCV